MFAVVDIKQVLEALFDSQEVVEGATRRKHRFFERVSGRSSVEVELGLLG